MDEKAKPIPIFFPKFGATSLFLVQFGCKSPKKISLVEVELGVPTLGVCLASQVSYC
jgi:hypothetical protein